ncbi:DUF2637 domain-containing protein [Micromonospora aurantiaca (nom. illeg.)]|uniref:DUF2637 domain-containing protein n=1 Tax=Micromonospora aurantiaca (nom. illeg.) TaxID=47850 RepID=UPI0033C0E5AB
MSTVTEAHSATTSRVGAPTVIALALIAAVWVCGAVWSFEEQTRLAQQLGFEIPELLPLTLDGLAVAMAAVAFAASLDARPAVYARLITAVAIGASAASNASAAWRRSAGDEQTVVIAAGVAVAAMFAFEVLLGEVRRQVLRHRGQPGPVAIVYPRLVRLFLSPWPTFTSWRRLVLDATDPGRDFDRQPPVKATVVDEDDPGIQACRNLVREMAAARQSIAPRVARVALAEHVLHWSAVVDRPPAPLALPAHVAVQIPARPTQPTGAHESVTEVVREAAVESIRPADGEPAREPGTDSRRAAAATQAPAQRHVTERLTKSAQSGDDRKLRQAYARLSKRLGREPSGQELGDEAGVSKATANRWKTNRKES